MIKKTFKFIIIASGIVAGLAIILTAGALVLINTAAVQRAVMNRINLAIPGSLEWRLLKIEPFKGRITVDDFRINDPDGAPMVSVDRVLVEIDLAGLLQRELRVDVARIEQPRILLATDPQGNLNLAAAFVTPDADLPETRAPVEPDHEPDPDAETDAAASGVNVRITAFDLTRGYFQFQTAPEPASDTADILVLEDIGISLKNADLAGRSGRLTMSMAGGRMDMAGIQTGLEKFLFDAGLDENRLDPFTIDIHTGGPGLMLSGAVTQVFDRPEISLNLDIKAELADMAQMLDPGVDLSGPLHIHMTASGFAADPVVTLEAEYGKGKIAGLDVEAAILAARLSERRVQIQRLSAGTEAGDIDIIGTLDLTAAFPEGFIAGPKDIDAIICELAVNADLPDLARSAKAFDLSGPGGGLSISADIAGPVQMPAVHADLKGSNLAWQDIRIGDLVAAADMDLQKGLLHIKEIILNNQQSSFRLAGTVDLLSPGTYALRDDPAFDLNVTDGILFAADFSDDVDGRLAFDASISGTLRQPAAKLFIQGEGLSAIHQKIGDITADLRLAQGRLTIDPIRVVNGGSVIMLTGSADVIDPVTAEPLDDPAMDITLSGEAVRIADFVPDLAGLVTVNGHVNGSLNQPHGHLRLQADDIDLGVQEIHQINLDARIDETLIHIEPLKISLSPDQSITLTGWVNMEKEYDLRLISDPISPAAIKALADVFPEGGRIMLEASGKGSFDDLQADAEIRISELKFNGGALPSLAMSLVAADQTLHIITRLKSHPDNPNDDPGNILLDGRLHIDTRDFNVRLDIDHADLAPYLAMAAQPELSGHLTAQIQADGNLSAPERVRADLHIADLSLLRDELEIIRSSDVKATYAGGLLSIPGSRVALLTEGYFDIRGTGRIDGELQLQADGAIPFKLLESFTDAVTGAGGSIDISAGVSGTASDPVIKADILLKTIGLTLPETGQRLYEVNGGIHITSDRIAIQDVRGRLDAGDFSISGVVDLADFQPVKADIAINARALPVKVPDTLDLLINAGITLSGDVEKSLLSGDITLLDGLYYRDIEFSLMDAADDIGRSRREFAPPPGTDAEDGGIPLLNNLAMDINVRHRNPFVVDNNMAVLHIRPDLRIHGTPNRPLISGRAQVADGVISFYNTEFTVNRGIIDFINPYKIEPTIDIVAQSQVRHWTITLAVTGPPDDLSVLLNSSPAEEHGDIISLLVVGKTTRELAGGEGGGATSPQQLLANLLAEQLQKNLQAGTGLDIIELEYTANGESDTGDDIRVTVGKEISRRLTLLYGVEQRSGLVVQKSTAIYKLLESLSVNAFQDTEGAFGGEMRYRLEFR